jgi:D-aminoacyl-tRNA deacylase
MRVVLQRVSNASVRVSGEVKGSIEKGLLLFVGVEPDDTVQDVQHLAYKVARIRVFSDKNGKMNQSLVDLERAECLVISQFTLFASTVKGHRPSFQRAAKPEFARILIEMFVQTLKRETNGKIESGVFGANMQVELLNDGPVTILLDTKIKDL